MQQVHQVHLKGPFHSQRVVQLKELDLFEHEANLLSAAKLCGENATMLDIKKTEYRQGAQAMIVAYSEPTDDESHVSKFVKVDQNALQSSFGEIFTAKDLGVLEQLFRQMHDVSGPEMDNIVGKMRPVSVG